VGGGGLRSRHGPGEQCCEQDEFDRTWHRLAS
jgi:hypothetical protein